MPTVFILLGFRFYFFANNHEPRHLHISRGSSDAKYNLVPKIRLIKNLWFKKSELKIIKGVIERNREIIIARWTDFFYNK